MVSGVLQNACLRMDEEGAGLDDILSPSGIHRWLGRGGIAIGGAASLLVGAVFGGILESVPVLLPPPAAAVSSPHIDSGGGAGLPANTPWTLAADAVPAVKAALQPAPAIGAPAGSNFTTVATPTLPSLGGGKATGGTVTQAGSGSGGVLGGGGNLGGGSTPSVPSSPSPGPAPSPVQPVIGVVQNTVGTVTGVVQNTVGTVSGATQTVLAPTSSGTSSSSSSPTSVVGGVTSTVTNTLSNTTSTLGL